MTRLGQSNVPSVTGADASTLQSQYQVSVSVPAPTAGLAQPTGSSYRPRRNRRSEGMIFLYCLRLYRQQPLQSHVGDRRHPRLPPTPHHFARFRHTAQDTSDSPLLVTNFPTIHGKLLTNVCAFVLCSLLFLDELTTFRVLG